ncbi:MAG TPA: diacylglycerol kinase family protein [Ktedonobacteraceae bacterium]|nr:diacylglycerol kinase family protein [Ktedonobacteraceae bacterium]
MSDLPKILVIRSPHAGRSQQLPQALKLLRQANVELVDVLSIAELDGRPNQGTHWKSEGIDAVIAAGGDGVVGGVITHIIESGLPLGIIPLGTANDIARSLRIPLDIQKAAEVISQGRSIDIDMGVARPAQQTPKESEAKSAAATAPIPSDTQKHGYFAHALTVGLNVDFARLATNVAIRRRFGRLTYPVAALEVLHNYSVLDMNLLFEGLALSPTFRGTAMEHSVISEEPVPLNCQAIQVAAINAPIFGGRWEFSIPGATLEDHLLDIVIIEDWNQADIGITINRFFAGTEETSFNPLGWHSRYPELQKAELTWLPGVHHVRARSLSIMTTNDPQDMTLDGEIRGKTPGHIQIANERLHVLVP